MNQNIAAIRIKRQSERNITEIISTVFAFITTKSVVPKVGRTMR